MSEIVFILGAGASKEAGAPLMNDFLDVAEILFRQGKADKYKEDFELVFKGIAALQHAHTKAQIDIDNIESVFAAFEMAYLTGRLGTLKIEEIERLPIAMRRVIEKTLEMSIVFRTQDNKVLPSGPYDNLARMIMELPAAIQNITTSIITFNYDLCIDYAFYCRGLPINYCLDDNSEASGIKIMKLHGSLNWTVCPICEEVVPWHLEDFFRTRDWNLLLTDAKQVHLNIASSFTEFEHCGTKQSEVPMIVPPTWNKTQYHERLQSVWRAAAAELANAENIFISGYSLPSTDQFFRYLYALGTISTTRLKRFWIFDPDDKVGQRFLGLLGDAAERRYKQKQLIFPKGLDYIRNELGVHDSR